MLAIRLAGVPRFIVGRWPLPPPDNSDGPDQFEAMAGGRLPSLARSGISWTRHGRRGGLNYRRFPSAALALRYAMEQLVAAKLTSATLEVDGERYDSAAMRRLYSSPDFPVA